MTIAGVLHFFSVTTSCTSRNCPCAKAGRPCHSCDPGECNRCTNTVEALNRVIRSENHRQTSGIGARFRRCVGRELEPTLPLYELGDALPADDDEDELAGIENNNLPDTRNCPSTIRSTTALRERCCCLSSKLTKTTTTMTHHPLLSASRPMGAMHHRRQPPLLTIRSMGAMPPRHRPLLSACRPTGAICRRKEMPRMLVPMATMWDPLALVSRMPLTFLLCNNQPFFQFFDEDMRELGSRRR